MKQVSDLLKKHNALLICDEVQAGLGRTGKMLSSDHDNVRPDIVLLAKSLSGGVYPVSAVLCDNFIMELVKPGEHGSTFGGNPLACAVVSEALDVIVDEKLVQNSARLGDVLINNLKQIFTQKEHIKDIRGKGLFIGVEFHDKAKASQVSNNLLRHGVIAKPTRQNVIRLNSPLVINDSQIQEVS